MNLLTSVTALALLAAGDFGEARITDLDVTQEGQQIHVSFQLMDGFTESILERIQSGLPTGFTYVFKIERIRRWWPNNTLQKSTLQVVAMYNAVTREYLINYKRNGKLIDSRVVQEVDELERAMTILHAVPAFSLEDFPQHGRLVVRVRAELGSRTILGFIPTRIETPWTESTRFPVAEDET